MKEKYPKLREAKDSQEYDYEGDMAKSDLRSIIHNAKTLHDMLDDDTNLAEWCQSKITLAEDYISTVTNYMRSEMNEEVELDEAKKMEYNQKDVYHLQGCVRELEAMKKQISKLAGNHDAVFKTIDKAIDVFAKEYTKHLNALSAGRGQDDNFKVPEMFSKLKFKKSKKTNEEVEHLDEKKKLPGLWANIHAKRKRGEAPAKPGDEDYPKTLNIEDANPCWTGYKRKPGTKKYEPGSCVKEGVQDDPKADQMTTDDTKFPKKSRKAAIVKSAAKKMPAEDQFQAKPVLDSQVAQQTNK